MSREKVGFSLRPERIAFLVCLTDPHWIGSCARILEYCSLTWGGAGNIIVPTDGATIAPAFWDLLERFEPDYVTFYRRSGMDVKRDDPVRFTQYLDKCIKQWEFQIGETSQPFQAKLIEEDLLCGFADNFSVSEPLQKELKDRLSPFYYGEHVVQLISANSQPHYPHTQLSHVLKAATDDLSPVKIHTAVHPEVHLWTSSALGYVSPEHYDWFTNAGASISCEEISGISVVATEVVAHAIGLSSNGAQPSSTPFDATRIVLAYYQSLGNHDYDLPTLIVAGEGIIDFCYYICLSRMRVRVMWLPPWFVRDVRNISEQEGGLPDAFYYCSAVQMAAGYSNQHSNSIALVSLTMSMQEQTELLTKVGANSLTPLKWQVAASPDFNLEPLRLYERNNAGIPELYETNPEGIIELYTGRPPKHLKDFSPQNIRWIAEIALGDVQIPRHPALGTWIAGRSTSEARTTKNRLCYLNVNMMVMGSDDPEAASYRPHLRVPSALGMFTQIASQLQIHLAPSDKGIYTRVTLEKFGGLENAARFFRSEVGGRMTAAYQAGKNAGAGIFLSDEQRLFLDWHTIRSFCNDDTASTKVIDDLSGRSIFYRGFKFQCELCRRSSWYSVSDLKDTFICKRCHREQTYTSMHWGKTHQPLWLYQLDEVVYQAIQNDCNIPILALSALSLRSKERLTFCEELEFLDRNSKSECDLNCVINGELTIGEVKKADRLGKTARAERQVLAKYLLLAERLGATQIVFATLAQQWRPETARMISEQFQGRRQKPILLNKDDLSKSPEK